jgi:hypothetical protein
MIKEALQYLQSLAVPQTVSVEGRAYATGSLKPVLDPTAEAVEVHTLTGLATYINDHQSDLPPLETLMLVVLSPTTVLLGTHAAGEFRQRRSCALAKTQHQDFPFGQYLPQEEFCIALMTRFVHDENQEAVLALAGNLAAGMEVQTEDDGFTQRVTVQTGVVRKANVKVTNPVILRPYRTFIEVEQAPCPLVIRMRKGKDGTPECALFEADGGLWKTVAAKNIHDWLRANVKDVSVLA